jgi:L-lactate dehydrogenase
MDAFFPVHCGALHDQQPSQTKITIVGVGAVGMVCAFSIAMKRMCTEIMLIDVDKQKLHGEVLDLEQASQFHGVTISSASDYEESRGSAICILSAGVRQREGESRDSLFNRNLKVLQSVVPYVVKYSPDVLFVVVSNPVDLLTLVTWKLSGLPQCRVLGSGCVLDTSRFRTALGKILNMSPSNVHGWIIGQHGDDSIPCWGSFNIAGVQLLPQSTDSELQEALAAKGLSAVHKEVVNSAAAIIKAKGYTNWAIAASVTTIVESILHNNRAVLSVSTLVKGLYGIEEEVFLSLPCILDRQGVHRIVKQPLTDRERSALLDAAKKLGQQIAGKM